MNPSLDLPMMEATKGATVLFHPHISEGIRLRVFDQLGTRWIGQGPAVEEFERRFSETFCRGYSAVATGSGTDALHLAYLLAGIGPGDEVITPLFTCTATNIPLLYLGARPVFSDIQPHTMNMDPAHARKLVTPKTKAIVCVHYGGLPCDLAELRQIADDAGIPVIEDAAHALGAEYRGQTIGSISDYTMFSFQAVKHITTGDGGLLSIRDQGLHAAAKRLRWFGIDRQGKQTATWDNDIHEIGFKYQMTDVAAAMGLASLDEWETIKGHRRRLFALYEEGLSRVPGLQFVGGGYTDRSHAAWICTVLVKNRRALQQKLRDHGIESNQVHYRNDRYSIFRESRGHFPQMDSVEDDYLVLPLHTQMKVSDVGRIIQLIQSGW